MLPQEMVLKACPHHLGDVVHAEAAHEVEAMDLHGAAADPEDASRLVIRVTQDDQLEDFFLAWGQAITVRYPT
jgi:hypothetical protein